MAEPIDLNDFWPGRKKPEKGYWEDWQDWEEENASKWQCKWENEEAGNADAGSSAARPARSQSRGRSPSKPVKGSEKTFFQKDICQGGTIPK